MHRGACPVSLALCLSSLNLHGYTRGNISGQDREGEFVCACTHVEVTIVCAGVSWRFWCPGGTVVQVPGLY